jgi:hypothetical protein
MKTSENILNAGIARAQKQPFALSQRSAIRQLFDQAILGNFIKL